MSFYFVHPASLKKAALLLLLSIGCTQEVDLDLPAPPDRLVVNALFTADEPLTVAVSQTHSPLRRTPPRVENAHVRLQSAAGEEVLHDEGDGTYTTAQPLAAGETYRLLVSAPGLAAVSAQGYVPRPMPRPDLTPFVDSVGVDAEGNFFSQFQLRFADDASTADFYEVGLRTLFQWEGTGQDNWNWLRQPFTEAPFVLAEGLGDYFPETLLFSDRAFNGQTCTLMVHYQPITVDPDYRLIVSFRRVSADYYAFRRSLYIHIVGEETGFWEGVGDPVPMFTNVEGGYGIFAGYWQHTDTLSKQR